MTVKFIEKIRDSKGLSRYMLAKKLTELLDAYVATASIDHYEESGKALRPDILCGIRKIGGLTWSEFGKMLDEEFLKGK